LGVGLLLIRGRMLASKGKVNTGTATTNLKLPVQFEPYAYQYRYVFSVLSTYQYDRYRYCFTPQYWCAVCSNKIKDIFY
jgi:hypothetical protein